MGHPSKAFMEIKELNRITGMEKADTTEEKVTS